MGARLGAKEVGRGRDLEIPKDIHVMQVARQMVLPPTDRPEKQDHDAAQFLELSHHVSALTSASS